MARRGGWVASVGDQLSADVDILENADMYTSLGGFSALEITTGLGSQWSPPAVWFRYGRQSGESLAGRKPSPFAPRRRGGARSLLLAYRWGCGPPDACAPVGPPSRTRRREIAFIAGVLLYRRDRFLEGPGDDGRYLSDERFSAKEVRVAARAVQAERARQGAKQGVVQETALTPPGGSGCVWPAASAGPRRARTRTTRRRRRSARRSRAGPARCRA